MAEEKKEGLSPQTLLIASASSAGAAIIVKEIWGPGAIVAAAVMPVIVSLIGEALKKPTAAITTLRQERTGRMRLSRTDPEGEHAGPATRPQQPAAPPPPEFERPDPFGIWHDDKPSWRERLSGRHLRLALVTGVLAFLVAAFALTGTELIFGGSAGSGGGRTTLFSGKKDKQERDRERDEESPAQPGATTPADEPDDEEAPEEPAQTTTTAPSGGTPAPAETSPGAPPPEQPAPTPPAP